MRVLWLSPWLRSLSRVHVEALADQGCEVLLVTSDRHPESDALRPYEVVTDPSAKRLESWPGFGQALRRARRFRPDVVVTELVFDPRWLLFCQLAPMVHLIHDDAPHDASEVRSRQRQALYDLSSRRAKCIVVFSEYVASRLREQAPRPLSVVPLTSDLDPSRAPALVDAAGRRDFVMVGRISEYKNLPVVLDAWQQHRGGTQWRGDRLVILGDGPRPGVLPEDVEWTPGRFRYDDVLPRIAAAKGSVVHYRTASQSGAQLMAMQLGVTPLISDVGGLPEFQPPSEPASGVDDPAALAHVLDGLADPAAAAARGAAARAHYAGHYSAAVAAAELRNVFAQVTEGRA